VPTRDTAPTGAPCWIELFATDTDRARAFYRDLFGWTSEAAGPEYGGYINFATTDGVRVAGCMANDGANGTPDGWSVYLATDDATKTVERAEANGGTTIVPAMEVMDLGSMAVVIDAGGAAIGAWQPGTHTGFGVIDEPGAPSWFELHTREYTTAVAFYRDVFDWDARTMSDTYDFRYTTLGEGDDALAGIMDRGGDLPEGVPSHWSIYFHVADCDAAAAKVSELGGTLDSPPSDTPYGRIAEVRDAGGVAFRLRQPPTA
jgi:predicted enzyme related to lactoylglutathione lyase